MMVDYVKYWSFEKVEGEIYVRRICANILRILTYRLFQKLQLLSETDKVMYRKPKVNKYAHAHETVIELAKKWRQLLREITRIETIRASVILWNLDCDTVFFQYNTKTVDVVTMECNNYTGHVQIRV